MVPALAVADALRSEGAAVSFLGAQDRPEAALVPEAGYEIDFLAVRGLDRRNPLKAAGAAFRAARSIAVARRVLAARQAGVVMGGGGYVAGPAGLAALRLGLPLVLTEADSHLGLANRLLAKRARRVCLSFPIPGREGDPYLVTGRPVPAAIGRADRDEARRRFGIGPGSRCLLVFGGSQGARTINEVAFEAYGAGGSGGRDFHVLQISGSRDYEDLRRRIEEAAPARYTLVEYEPNLGDALAACDLVLARAGGSVFELAAAGRPAILVPFPHATADHQSSNARWMTDAGAAIAVRDSELTPEVARRLAGELLGDPGRLERMAAASRSLARPDAARRIASEVLAAAEAR